jgi:hypothetical protein
MKALFLAVALCAGATATSSAEALTPMNPGFEQTLRCNGGSVRIAVATQRNSLAPEATVVTTTLKLGDTTAVTRALRTMDAHGNIYAFGYAMPSFVKRFHKTLLLPSSPPRPGSATSYFNVSGFTVRKQFIGTRTAGTNGSTGYVFADDLRGHKLNTVTYVPSIGIATATFIGLKTDRSDLVCRSPGF